MLHPYFGTVLAIAILTGIVLVVTLVNKLYDLAEKRAKRKDRKSFDATFEAYMRALYAQHPADRGPIQ